MIKKIKKKCIYIQNKSLIPPHNINVLLKIYCCWVGVFCMVLRVLIPPPRRRSKIEPDR